MPSVDKLGEWSLLPLLKVDDNRMEIVIMSCRIGLAVLPHVDNNLILIFHLHPPVGVPVVCRFPGRYIRQRDTEAGLWQLKKDADGTYGRPGIVVFVVGDLWFRSIRSGMYCSGGIIRTTESGAREWVSLWGSRSANGQAAMGLPAKASYFLLHQPTISSFSRRAYSFSSASCASIESI